MRICGWKRKKSEQSRLTKTDNIWLKMLIAEGRVGLGGVPCLQRRLSSPCWSHCWSSPHCRYLLWQPAAWPCPQWSVASESVSWAGRLLPCCPPLPTNMMIKSAAPEFPFNTVKKNKTKQWMLSFCIQMYLGPVWPAKWLNCDVQTFDQHPAPTLILCRQSCVDVVQLLLHKKIQIGLKNQAHQLMYRNSH